MCGIVGKISLEGAPVSLAEIEAMRETLVHRGPDDEGRVLFSLRSGRSFTPTHEAAASPADAVFEGALGFNRLSVIDTSSAGRQPMHSLDGRTIIVFNGEIYNADEYRPELERRGHRFRGTSDTEVLLNLYDCFGIDGTLERLNGMFAFCIVDLGRGELYLARDRMGIKPLYLHHSSTTLMFASEIKAFLPSAGFCSEINVEAAGEFVKFGGVAGTETLFRGVRNVEPGELLALTNGTLRSHVYWRIPDADPRPMTVTEAQNRVFEVLSESVRLRLKSDVPVGCQLSGGIDSSLICLLASRRASGKPTTAVSVVLRSREFNEERWADQVSATVGIDVRKLRLDESRFLDDLERATWHYDLPLSWPSGVAIMQMSELAKRHFTVFLSGEGADELFGGYERFYGGHFLGRAMHYHALRLTPARGLLWDRYVSDPAIPFNRRDWFITRGSYLSEDRLKRLYPDRETTRFMEKRRAIFDAGEGDFISRAQRYELRTGLLDLLRRQDKLTMAHGIENRVPFLDHNLVGLARKLPISCLVGLDPRFNRSTKIVLKRTAAKHFGKRFAYRRKIGFRIPLTDAFATPEFESWMRDEILPGIKARGIFDHEAVASFHRPARQATPEDDYSVWRMVTFEVWARRMIDRRAPAVS